MKFDWDFNMQTLAVMIFIWGAINFIGGMLDQDPFPVHRIMGVWQCIIAGYLYIAGRGMVSSYRKM